MKKRIIIGITGASGAVYAQSLLRKLAFVKEQIELVNVIFSTNAKAVWDYELGNNYELEIANYEYTKQLYSNDDMFAPAASGSANFDTMIICPCSMGTLGRITNGTSDNLIVRAADVMLKERKKLILATREMPLSLIHINNMKTVTEAGGIICPASPSFYSKPADMNSLVNTVIDKILGLSGFTFEHYRWG